MFYCRIQSCIKMSGYIMLLSVILVTKVTTINVTNSGNQQEIKDIKKDLTMLRSLVTSLNTSLQHKDDEIREMNATIQAQQQEIELLREENEKGIQSNAAFQLIIQDLVTNFNSWRNSSQLHQSHVNENLTSLANQIHYTSLSFLDTQKTLTVLENATKEINKSVSVVMRNLNSQELDLNNLSSETNRTMSSIMINQKSHAQEINNLRSEINKSVSVVVRNLNSQEQDLNNLSSETNRTMSSIMVNQKSHAQEINHLRSETNQSISSVINNLKVQERELKHLSSEMNKTIVFTASSTSTLQHYNNKKIIYNKVITNRGSAYDINTGIFTCPSPGAYVFTWSSMSWRDVEECALYIFHNGVRLLESDSDNEGNHQFEVASNTITLVLAKGDRVWIQTTLGDKCAGYPYTGFSGWKI